MTDKFTTLSERLLMGAMASCALCGAFGPRLAFGLFSAALSYTTGIAAEVRLAQADAYPILVALALAPLLFHDAWHAAPMLEPITGGAPPALTVLIVSGVTAPIWGAIVSTAFGIWGGIGAFLWYEVALLSVPAFVVCVAQVAAESRGERPRTALLAVLYHGGGALGVYLARRYFPDSKAIEAATERPPAGMLFLAILAGLAVALKVL